MKADLKQMKEEHTKARTEMKANLQDKINQLDSKLQNFMRKDQERVQAVQQAAKKKLQILKEKASSPTAKVS
jgi:hypothetical protein